MNLLSTAIISYCLRKISQIMSKSFQASLRSFERNVHSLAEHFQTPVIEPKTANINYFNVPKKHRGPRKISSQTAYSRPLI